MSLMSYVETGAYMGAMVGIFGAAVTCGSVMKDLEISNTIDIQGRDYISAIVGSLISPLVGGYIGVGIYKANRKLNITIPKPTQEQIQKIACVTLFLFLLKEGYMSGKTQGLKLS